MRKPLTILLLALFCLGSNSAEAWRSSSRKRVTRAKHQRSKGRRFGKLVRLRAPKKAAPQKLAKKPVVKKASETAAPIYAQSMRQALKAGGAEVVGEGKVFYHQIKDASHRASWAAKFKSKGLAAMGEWLSAGRYPGIWTIEEKGGWYGNNGGNAVGIKLKKGSLFIDLENPAQRAVYEQWKTQAKAKAKDPKDLFQVLKDASGTPLASKVPGVRAPTNGRFYQELNIAGVVWYDTYGRRCPIVLNPQAVDSVSF